MYRKYRRFNAMGTQLTVQLLPPTDPENTDPMTHFVDTIKDIVEYATHDCRDSDMVGLTISNEDENVADRAVCISVRRKDQLSAEAIWAVFEKVVQSNASFGPLDRLVIQLHAVRMPSGHGGDAVKAKGRKLSVMAQLKRSIVEVKSETNCLAHALLIARARVDNDPDYDAYRRGGRGILLAAVDNLLQTTGIDLQNGGGIAELDRLQTHFENRYRIVVYGGLHCEDVIDDGRVECEKRLNLLYDDVTRHYHVITSLTGAMTKRHKAVPTHSFM
jgi:hypothetical protein